MVRQLNHKQREFFIHVNQWVEPVLENLLSFEHYISLCIDT